jgi:hypothetical protein
MVTTSCKHDADDYVKKPYTVTDNQRLEYAQETLQTTFDKQQDWVLTKQCTVDVKADADLEGISQVAILNGNPYVGTTSILALVPASKDETMAVTFKAPLADDVLYAACVTRDQKYIARPFLPGQDTSVSFSGDHQKALHMMTRGMADGATILDPVECWDIKYKVTNLSDLQAEAHRFVPSYENNRNKVEAFNNHSFITRSDGESSIGLQCIYARKNVPNVHIGCRIDPGQQGTDVQTYVLKDGIVNGQYFRYETPYYMLWGTTVPLNYDPDESEYKLPANTKIEFFVVNDNTDLSDDVHHATCFSVNDNSYLAISTSDTWDYYDRVFLITGGGKPAPKTEVKPITPTPQIWTYVWEDKDFGDYDMNDCVIEVQEHADDASKITVTLVALGGARNLWLGFDSKTAESYLDHKPVIDKELHAVLGVPVGTLVNTGHTNANPVVVYDGPKPEGFDFQTCSFVLGAMFKDDQKGIYENDYYHIHIATKGQDPHGIVIPAKWQWPKEKTCIKDAYPEFVTWANDRTKAQDWYKHPIAGKVITLK